MRTRRGHVGCELIAAISCGVNTPEEGEVYESRNSSEENARCGRVVGTTSTPIRRDLGEPGIIVFGGGRRAASTTRPEWWETL